jgi:hypothetical protein
MDSERKMISVVKNLLRVVEELAEEHGVSEASQAALEKAKRDAGGLRTRADEAARE